MISTYSRVIRYLTANEKIAGLIPARCSMTEQIQINSRTYWIDWEAMRFIHKWMRDREQEIFRFHCGYSSEEIQQLHEGKQYIQQ